MRITLTWDTRMLLLPPGNPLTLSTLDEGIHWIPLLPKGDYVPAGLFVVTGVHDSMHRWGLWPVPDVREHLNGRYPFHIYQRAKIGAPKRKYVLIPSGAELAYAWEIAQ